VIEFHVFGVGADHPVEVKSLVRGDQERSGFLFFSSASDISEAVECSPEDRVSACGGAIPVEVLAGVVVFGLVPSAVLPVSELLVPEEDYFLLVLGLG
jgi:hypothetical protein